MKKQRFRIDPNTLVLLKQITIGILVLSLVALLVTGVWYGSRVQALTLTDVSVSGGETIEHEEIKDLVQAQLEGEYLGLVPRRFAWLYPKEEIHQALDSIDRIYNIQLERTSGTALKVTFDEHVPDSLWCETVESDRCLFMNKEGLAFAEAPDLAGGSFLRFIRSGQEPRLDETIIDKESFLAIGRLHYLLEENGWYVSHIEIDQVGDIFITLVDEGELKTSLSLAPEETVDNLFTILSSEKFTHIEPGNFNYIDLRFEDRVFVNEELSDSEEEVEMETDDEVETNEEDAE